LDPKSEEFDQEWAMNAFSHTVWKLAGFQSRLNHEILNIENIIYGMIKRYHREFSRGKRSFFQRVLQKDEPIN
jgi:hypothetical protein